MERQQLLSRATGHCELNKLNLSPVECLFENRSVFITGATGFIGRVLVEKLLRCYPGIKKIYLLMRTKKNLPPTERLQAHLLNVPIFDKIRSNEELIGKLVVVPGDIALPQLGIRDQDLQMMLADLNLSIVFHSAANTRFNEPLKLMVQQNLMATREVINLSKRLTNLLALCHVSSTFANCHLKEGQDIKECLYSVGQRPAEVISMAESLNQEMMEKLKVELIDERPNTYTYTKALGEHLIFEEANELPIVIVRPSTVMSAWKEPLPGWIDNINGPTGMILAIGKGLVRSYCAAPEAKADIVPVDLVVNTMITAAFYVASNDTLKVTSKDEDDLPAMAPIIHCNSGDLNPMTWSKLGSLQPILRNIAFAPALRYPAVSFTSNKYHNLFVRLFLHYLPALIIDLYCWVNGQKGQMLPMYQKIHKAMDAYEHFSTTLFNFKTNNIKLLKSALKDERDRQSLWLDIKELNWDEYWLNVVTGIRRYILKESDKTLPEARKSLIRTYYIEMSIKLGLFTLIAFFILFFINLHNRID